MQGATKNYRLRFWSINFVPSRRSGVGDTAQVLQSDLIYGALSAQKQVKRSGTALLPLPPYLVSQVFLPDLAYRPPWLTVRDSLPPPSTPPLPHHTFMWGWG